MKRSIQFRVAYLYAMASAFTLILLCSGPNLMGIFIAMANFFIARAWQHYVRYGRI
jgi:hypothetical protein